MPGAGHRTGLFLLEARLRSERRDFSQMALMGEASGAATRQGRRAPGRKRASSRRDRLFADALVSVLAENDSDDVKKLHKVASALVDKAIAGDTAAIREIADRIDGKPGAADRERDGDGTIIVEIIRYGSAAPRRPPT